MNESFFLVEWERKLYPSVIHRWEWVCKCVNGTSAAESSEWEDTDYVDLHKIWMWENGKCSIFPHE